MRKLFFLLCFIFLFSANRISVHAAETSYPFSPINFQKADVLPDGILITGLSGPCQFRCGNRQICSGDALTAEQLSTLRVIPQSETVSIATLTCIPVYGQIPGPEDTCYLTLRGTKNQPPIASDSEIETYKNLETTGKLPCTDPEGDSLIYTLTAQPRRGEVAFRPDGTFIYVPDCEKVGTDRFSFVAEDIAGNCSQEATVTVTILKPVSSAVFSDMTDDPDQFYALFLKDSGLFSGEQIGETLCFQPDQTCTKEEYVMMLLSLSGLEPEAETFGPSQEWFAPWKTAAMRAGLPMEYDPHFTVGEAVGLTKQLLHLEMEDPDGKHAVLTRRTAAQLLCRANALLDRQVTPYPWQ